MITKQIEKRVNLLHKKYCALKTGKIEEDIQHQRNKPIVESLKQIVENIANDEFQPIKKEVNVAKGKNITKRKPEDNEDVHDVDDNDSDGLWMNNSCLKLTPSSKKHRTKELNVTSKVDRLGEF